MKCNVITDSSFIKVNVENKSQWVSVHPTYFTKANTTCEIPLEFLGGSDASCISSSVGTITGNTLSIPVGTDSVDVRLTDAKVLVTAVNADQEAVSGITPASKFATIGNTEQFNISFKSGFSYSGCKVVPSGSITSDNTVQVTAPSTNMQATVAKRAQVVTIVSETPFASVQSSTVVLRYGTDTVIPVQYTNDADYTCIKLSITGSVSASVTYSGISLKNIRSDCTVTIRPAKTRVTFHNDAIGRVTSISGPSFALIGSTTQYTLQFAGGYTGEYLHCTAGTISGNTMTVYGADAPTMECRVYYRPEYVLELHTDSTSGDQYVPTYIYYNNSFTQQIYTTDELSNHQFDMLTSMAFYASGNETGDRQLSIYLTNIDDDAPYFTTGDSMPISDAPNFVGTVSFTDDDWTEITMTTPFRYTGHSILLTVVDSTGTYTSSPSYKIYNTSNYSALYAYSDYTTYNARQSISCSSASYKNSVKFTFGAADN